MMSIKKYYGENGKFKPIILITLISSLHFYFGSINKIFVVHILDLSGRLSITLFQVLLTLIWHGMKV